MQRCESGLELTTMKRGVQRFPEARIQTTASPSTPGQYSTARMHRCAVRKSLDIKHVPPSVFSYQRPPMVGARKFEKEGLKSNIGRALTVIVIVDEIEVGDYNDSRVQQMEEEVDPQREIWGAALNPGSRVESRERKPD